AAHPWPAAERRAAVSAFGFGGTNFHAVIEGHGEAPAVGLEEWPAELFVLRGATRAAAAAAGAAVEALAAARHRLRALARSVAEGSGPAQIAFVAESADDLRAKLAAARDAARPSTTGSIFVADVPDEVRGGALAMLFPGQGSQRPGMLADLFVAFPSLQDILARGKAWLPILFPPAAFTPAERNARRAAITHTRAAQPAPGLCDLDAAHLLQRCGVRGAMLGGHSYGELAALAVAGALREDDLPALSEGRALDILAAARGAPGTMAAVKAGAAEVTAALGEGSGVVLANLNAPDQTVIAGSDEAVDAAVSRLAAAGLSARRILVACAFHSPIVAAAGEAFRRRLDGVSVVAPRVPVYSNTTAERYP